MIAWDGRKLVQEALCDGATWPKSNRAFWNGKFRRNARRDERNEARWREEGWNVVVLWTCGLSPGQLGKTLDWLERKLEKWAPPAAARPSPRRRPS